MMRKLIASYGTNADDETRKTQKWSQEGAFVQITTQ